MDKKFGSHFSEDVESFFASGTVILFTCKSTSDFPLLSVSENAKQILGFEREYFLGNEHAWSHRIHPDDREQVLAQFKELVANGGGAINEYRFKTKQGHYIWLRDEIKVIEDSSRKEELIYGASLDITERKKAEITIRENKTEELKQEISRRKKAEKQLQKSLAYEKAISQCSELLLGSNSPKALKKSLGILQEVTKADRIFLYKNKDIDGDLSLHPVMEVTKDGVDSIVENLDQQFKYSDIPSFYEKLSSLEKVHAKVDELPEPERSILEEQQVKSILIIPFAVENEWKGYVGFADTHRKRVWEEEEISLLTTVSRIIAAFEKRKAIEQSLVEQRNYTDTILDNLPSIYLLMNDDLQFVQWNSYTEKLTGYSGNELQSKTAFDLIVPEEHEAMKSAIDQVRDQKGEGKELQLMTKSGEKIPFFWRGYFIELKGEQYFLCVGIDITQQKESEMDLRREKQFNEALLESLPGIFYMFDKDGNYYRWNQNLLDVTGYTEEDMHRITPDVFFPEKELDKGKKAIQKVFEVGEITIESKLKTKGSEEIPYQYTGKLLETDDKDYLLGVGHDISEQFEARQKLRRNEELFRTLFLQSPAAIVMVDKENNVQDINKSFANLFGYEKEELIGKDIDEYIVPESERGVVPRMPLDEYSADSFHREAKRRTKDGGLIDVFIAAIPVYIDGEPFAGFGMYIDITEEKRYEKQIASSLKEKKTMLKEIHHRVKNNLAIVSGLLQLQMYESDDPLIHDTLKESERRIQTMALIHEKLYNSDSLGCISCDTYIGDLVETISTTIGSDQNVEVDIDIDDIEIDIKRAVPFALLVNEVVTNSFKHAFDGQGDHKIAIKVAAQNGRIKANINDNGKGLPEDLNPDESDTLGMRLIDNFAQQLEAEWEMGSDNGTYINLAFNIDEDNM